MKLTLDADAADLLLQLAGSPRKQGEYVSQLIRAAAIGQGTDPAAPTRQGALQVAAQLALLANQLMELAGQPTRFTPTRIVEGNKETGTGSG